MSRSGPQINTISSSGVGVSSIPATALTPLRCRDQGGKIAAVDSQHDAQGGKVRDVTGAIVAPG